MLPHASAGQSCRSVHMQQVAWVHRAAPPRRVHPAPMAAASARHTHAHLRISMPTRWWRGVHHTTGPHSDCTVCPPRAPDLLRHRLPRLEDTSLDNNAILRRIAYMFSYTSADVAEVMELGGHRLSPSSARARMKREEERGAVFCDDDILEAFLDGLVIRLRGPRPPGTPVPPRVPLTNNEVLKKLRIAFKLKDTDMLRALQAGGITLSKAELSALFRTPSHRHHRACGDQVLRKFLVGITPVIQRRVRGPA